MPAPPFSSTNLSRSIPFPGLVGKQQSVRTADAAGQNAFEDESKKERSCRELANEEPTSTNSSGGIRYLNPFGAAPYSVSRSRTGSRCAVTLLFCAVLTFNVLPLVTTTHAMKPASIRRWPSLARHHKSSPRTRHPSPQLASSEQLASAKAAFGSLPIYFEENRGQTDEPLRFLTRGAGYSLFLADGEAVLSLQRPVNSDTSISCAGQSSQSPV